MASKNREIIKLKSTESSEMYWTVKNKRKTQRELEPGVWAVAKFARVSTRRAREVAALVRGKQVEEAMAILKFTPRKAAAVIAKVIKSAMANAENNHDMKHENLYVAEIYANQGPTLKRIRPAAKGSAVRIRKRTSHITIVLREKEA